jgi:DNA-binding CsgD family transcriptional regulator
MSRPDTRLADGLEALRYVARGWSGADTGRAIGISEAAVRTRLRRLYVLLGARDAAHAVAIAGVQRLLTAEDLRAAVAERRAGWKAPEEEEA